MRSRSLCLLALTLAAAAHGGYQYGGYDLEVLRARYGLTNAALHVGRGGMFTTKTEGINDELVIAPDFSFDLPAGDAVRYARLSIGWWGGRAEYEALLGLSVNGQALDPLIFGSESDANPVHDASGVSVYGAGAGMWLTCFDVTDKVLLGQTNQVEMDIEPQPTADPSDPLFDGRCYHWELVMAYDTPTDYTLSYQIAEGYGSLREYVPELTHRMVGFSPVTLTEPYEADLVLAYTHGNVDQLDWAEFNGYRLDGTDNLADASEPSEFIDHTDHPEVSYFDFELLDVAAHLDDTANELHIYTPPDEGEKILNIASAILVTRELLEGNGDVIPEPATVALLGLGALAARGLRRRSLTRGQRRGNIDAQ